MTISKAERGFAAPFVVALILTTMTLGPVRLVPLAFVQTAAPPGSWALGLVVPQGSSLAGGKSVDWGNVENLTAVVKLPRGTTTDNTILAVLSVMVGDSSVIQVAAGLFPGQPYWRPVGWYIPDVGAASPYYEWTLNSTVPAMTGNSTVSLSLYRLDSQWQYMITDTANHRSVSGAFSNAPSAPIRSGDEEAFALESYTTNATVLTHEGNLTLNTLLLNGSPVIGGTYFIGDWDPSHQPLFVVGGTSVPSPVSVLDRGNGTFIWSYSSELRSFEIPTSAVLFPVALLLVSLSVVVFGFVVLRNLTKSRVSRGDSPQPRKSALSRSWRRARPAFASF